MTISTDDENDENDENDDDDDDDNDAYNDLFASTLNGITERSHDC